MNVTSANEFILQDHQINVVGLDEKLVNSCEQVLEVIKNGEGKKHKI